MLDKLAEDTKDVVFLKVDVDKYQALVESFEVTSMPTIIGYKNGAVTDRVIGAYIEKITEMEFKQKIATGAVIVDFYATWCGPCKRLAPMLDKLAEDTKDVVFLKVDVDNHQALAESSEVTSMPTIIGYKNGAVIDRVLGANIEKVTEMVKKLTA
ncbi:unnamed protein product [Dibothriocephalus latus]|uniref:Thioredoxin domain-containing protein n=1 Tax=Dibothriocephalus latus TaxID=60516 RepID=A0A3P7LII2_DIBLA|nr:unnamed protein product [Dibothriocephalus latus]